MGQMDTNNTTPLATVTLVAGKVWAEAEDGTRHLLQSGDTVAEGEVIVTDDGSRIELIAANGSSIKISENKEIELSAGLFDNTLERIVGHDTENPLHLDLRGAVAATDSNGRPIPDDLDPDASRLVV